MAAVLAQNDSSQEGEEEQESEEEQAEEEQESEAEQAEEEQAEEALIAQGRRVRQSNGGSATGDPATPIAFVKCTACGVSPRKKIRENKGLYRFICDCNTTTKTRVKTEKSGKTRVTKERVPVCHSLAKGNLQLL
jgi:hypothetical protein